MESRGWGGSSTATPTIDSPLPLGDGITASGAKTRIFFAPLRLGVRGPDSHAKTQRNKVSNMRSNTASTIARWKNEQRGSFTT